MKSLRGNYHFEGTGHGLPRFERRFHKLNILVLRQLLLCEAE